MPVAARLGETGLPASSHRDAAHGARQHNESAVPCTAEEERRSLEVPREEATKKFQEINQAFQALSHWKETGTDLDSGDEVRGRGDRGADGFMDLAEMMMCALPAPRRRPLTPPGSSSS
ncbi:hypothetical protein JL722_7053 [Aureococcus anophagefferens]|nr:hypothetical protein JL722_7053 [Aureococcus anophagefferens]